MPLDVKSFASAPFSPDPFTPRLASDAATNALRQAITNGELEPGQRLKEAEIAETLGISRTPIRHAISTLEQEGLVETAPHRGARVKSYTPSDLAEMYDLRAVLEGHATELAAPRISKVQIATLEASCDRFERLTAGDDVAALVAENILFHTTILEAAGSARLGAMLRGVVVVPMVYRAYLWFSTEEKRRSEVAHREIVMALRVRDGVAAGSVMRNHLLTTCEVLLTRMRAQLDE